MATSTLRHDVALGVALGIILTLAVIAWATMMPAKSPEGDNPCAGARAGYENTGTIPPDCRDVIEWEP